MTEQSCHMTEQSRHMTEQSRHMTEQSCHMTKQSCDVTEQSRHMTEQSRHMTKQSRHMTEQSCHMTKQSCDVTEQSRHMTEQSRHMTKQSRHMTEQSRHMTKLSVVLFYCRRCVTTASNCWRLSATYTHRASCTMTLRYGDLSDHGRSVHSPFLLSLSSLIPFPPLFLLPPSCSRPWYSLTVVVLSNSEGSALSRGRVRPD